jgi:hypothetical protein
MIVMSALVQPPFASQHRMLTSEEHDFMLNQPTDTGSVTSLAQRLDAVEMQLATARRESQRWRAGTVIFACIGVSAVVLAATQSTRTPDVVRARRFEVVDQGDKVVLLAGIGQHGGQLDVWGNSGKNALRFGANPSGGDIAVWNAAEQGVAGIYATPEGGRVEATCGDGSSAVLRTDGGTPALLITDAQGNARIAATTTPASTGLSIRTADGKEVAALGATPINGGLIRISQEDGSIAVQAVALQHGGSIGVAARDGSRAALLESPTSSSGGTLSLFAPGGAETLSFTAHAEAGARITLTNNQRMPAAMLEVAANDSAILSFLQGGTRVAGLGGSSSGGLLNLSNATGKGVIVAGAASDADGGAISVRSGAGSTLVRLGVDRIGAGEVAVYDGPGTRKRLLSAIAAPP